MAARTAAQVAMEAGAAATAPNPRPATPPRPAAVPSSQARTSAASAPAASRPSARATSARDRAMQAARQGSRGLAPVKRASHALALEVTSALFALMAASFAVAGWNESHSFRGMVDGHHARAMVFSVFTVLLLYFSISGFLRAGRVARS